MAILFIIRHFIIGEIKCELNLHICVSVLYVCVHACVYQSYVCGFFPLVHNSSKTLQKIFSMGNKILRQLSYYSVSFKRNWGALWGYRNQGPDPLGHAFASTAPFHSDWAPLLPFSLTGWQVKAISESMRFRELKKVNS